MPRLIPSAILLLVLIFMAGSTPAQNPDAPMDRVAAWQRTLLAQNDSHPNAAVMTYIREGMENSRQEILLKISAEQDGLRASDASEFLAEDFPGGVQSTWSWGTTRASSRIATVLTPRIDEEWTGAAVFEVASDARGPITLNFGGGFRGWFHINPVEFMVDDNVSFPGTRVEDLGDGVLLFTADQHALYVVVRVGRGGEASLRNEDGAGTAQVVFPSGRGDLVVAFAETADRARELAAIEPAQALAQVAAYYDALLGASFIETPNANMDAAFRAAVIVNEYCWFAPLGWIEGVHHWTTLWHQQYIGMAHWLGQHDRARSALLETGARQLPNGAIPHLQPTGAPRRDFGGANQFYAWMAAQHHRKTADDEAMLELLPVLRRMLAHSRREVDQNGNLLFGWGLQIGNQEDFISTPYDGTTPSAEHINMIDALLVAESIAGNEAEVQRLRAERAAVAARMRARLFDPSLGRFVFMRDHNGEARLDGQYHSQVVPILAGLLGEHEAWSAMRHVADRLSREDGAVFVSNNFPDHLADLWSTWGMQAGAAQQPWAAWAHNRVGRTEDAVRPLAAAAEWVMGDVQRGTWPEVAYEIRPGYFSPPSALWIQAVVEAVFGLDHDAPSGVLHVRPAFPSDWPSARLVLPAHEVEYARDGGRIGYTVRTAEPMALSVRWPLPPGAIASLTVDGAPHPHEARPRVGGVELAFEVPAGTETRIEFEFVEAPHPVDGPGSVAEGDRARFAVAGAEVLAVEDPAGLLAEARIAGGAAEVRLREDLLGGYAEFGRLGMLNFSRRSIFLRVAGDGVETILPVDFVVLPRADAVASLDSTGMAEITIANNTADPVAGPALVEFLGGRLALDAAIPARGRSTLRIDTAAHGLRAPAPGGNSGRVVLSNGAEAEFVALAEGGDAPEPLALPSALLESDADYLSWRPWFVGHVSLWRSPISPMHDLADLEWIEPDELPGVRFAGPGRELIPVGHRPDSLSVAIPVDDPRPVRKAYLLVAPFVTNHEMFSRVGEVELVHAQGEGPAVGGVDRVRTVRTLRFPGDLDWYYPVGTVQRLSTWQGPRPARHSHLATLPEDASDWPASVAKPPVFPRPEDWTTSAALSTGNAVFNVIEVEPATPRPVESIIVRRLGSSAVLGIVGVSLLFDEED